MSDIQLSEHFALSEFTRSATASRKHIDNTPSLQAVSNMQQLCINVLEPLRQHVQHAIIITSGYRSKLLNAAVGGSSTSNHLRGCAADLHVSDDKKGLAMVDYIRTNLKYDELICERTSAGAVQWWIHVAYTEHNRNIYISNKIKNH